MRLFASILAVCTSLAPSAGAYHPSAADRTAFDAAAHLLDEGKPGEALQRFASLAKHHPDWEMARFAALLAAAEIGPTGEPKALPQALAALRSNLGPAAALRALGYVQFRAGNLRAASATFAELTDRAPEIAGAHYDFACVLAKLGRMSEALHELAEAVQLDRALAREARTDADLEPLRRAPGFARIVAAAG